jgi:surface polysaccharide O-acyltransferase-like enzyme
VSGLAGLCARRGALLLFILPLAVIRLGLHRFFPRLQDWSDFFYFFAFFVLGFLLYADERFQRAIRRDGWILLLVGAVAITAGTPIGISREFNLESVPRTAWDVLLLGLMVTCGWCWTAFMLYVGMRFLDKDSKALRYGLDTLLPFFVLHQPVILTIAYFVVQWQASLTVKLLVVILGSFLVTLALTEFVVKRIPFLRPLFGMKGKRPARPPVLEPQPTAPGQS